MPHLPPAYRGSEPRVRPPLPLPLILIFYSCAVIAGGSAIALGLPAWGWHTAPGAAFVVLFLFRYLRLVVGLYGYWRCTPIRPAERPRYTGSDVTVVIPTVDPANRDFFNTLQSIVANRPRAIFIVTPGETNGVKAQATWARLTPEQTAVTSCHVLTDTIANKRQQTMHGLRQATTPLVVSADDHVFWGPDFLPGLLAPFEDPRVGLVGTYKKVVRQPNSSVVQDFFNFLGCLYLMRHNFDIMSTSGIDGSCFVI